MRWQNWGRSFSADPISIARPQSDDEVAAMIAAHRGTGIGLKPIGAGHSFSAVGVPEGIQVQLTGFEGLTRVDPVSMRATFGAGTRLFQIAPLLKPYGLALPNMGDVDRQTISGAVSTGTHGTGVGLTSIGANIVAASLVTGTGEVLRISELERPELLPAIRLGIGAIGILTEVTLQCVPAFTLEATEALESRDAVLEHWEERVRAVDHFEWYWFPHTDRAVTKTNRRTGAPAAPLNPVRRFVDEEVIGNGAFRLMCAAGKAAPAIIPSVNKLAASMMGKRPFTDLSHRVFVTSRTVRFREMEFAVPLAAIPDVMRDLEAMIERKRWQVSFPMEVRAAAADDAMLSTAYNREVGYVAVHRYWREDPRELFGAAQQVFLAHEGRPHWGKMHSLRAADFAERLPQFDAFLAIRNELDPDRVFGNEYLRRVLGD